MQGFPVPFGVNISDHLLDLVRVRACLALPCLRNCLAIFPAIGRGHGLKAALPCMFSFPNAVLGEDMCS